MPKQRGWWWVGGGGGEGMDINNAVQGAFGAFACPAVKIGSQGLQIANVFFFFFHSIFASRARNDLAMHKCSAGHTGSKWKKDNGDNNSAAPRAATRRRRRVTTLEKNELWLSGN